MHKIVVIIGPTAVGKTSLSIKLAKKFHGEVINGDSMQVYRDLSIGTAKITDEEMEGIPHHLLSIRQVEEDFSASEFKQLASEKIDDITSRGKLPIVVGGTGLYIEGLLYDFHYGGQTDANEGFRLQKEQKAREEGVESLWEELKTIDPKACETIHPNNIRRVIRALEVYHETGELFSSMPKEQKMPNYDAYIICLNTNRELLYERINQRVHMMMGMGLEDEARKLLDYENAVEFQSFKGIGYKEWIPYFKGEQTKEEIIDMIQQQSRRYAKRQLTWFRNRFKEAHWFDLVQDPQAMDKVMCDIEQFMK